ncbi:hypothetical protein Godav_021778, partial [Gossypium davidsonii]|nr:hypothetical protein [Gossypium davidsonii]
VLHKEGLPQHILFDKSRRVGILKKIEKSEPSQDDTDRPILLASKILPFRRNWSYISFPVL